MKRGSYHSYRGRRTLGRRVLTAIVVLLAVVLALSVAALLVLPNSKYAVYTADGLRFDLPFLGRGQSVPSSRPDDGEGEPTLIVESASPVPESSAPAAAGIDLSGLARREPTLGLVEMAGEGPTEGQGGLFDMTGGLSAPGGLPQGDSAASREVCAALPYAAAWLAPDWDDLLAREGGGDDLTQWCLTLADGGYDEIVFSEAIPQDGGAALAQLYLDVKAALDEAGWQGRLGLVLDQRLAGNGYDEALVSAIARSFERLYFRSSLQTGVKNALTEHGFDDRPINIVTVYAAVPNVTWAWAVLPR